jgi:CRISPR-associated endonuclease/helicase Cas3
MTSASLGPAYYAYWGKAKPVNGSEAPYHPLAFHCLDVAATGRQLLTRHPRLLDWLAGQAGVEPHPMLDWLTFCLALHDLGKFATAFQNQRPDLLWSLQNRKSSKPYGAVRHDSLGELLWRTRLVGSSDVLGLGSDASRFASRLAPWIYAVTGHHGEPPDSAGAHFDQHFDARDEGAAAAFARDIRALFPVDTVVATLGNLSAEQASRSSRRCSWWLAGVAVLADWLGSNTTHFTYSPAAEPLDGYWRGKALPCADRALNAAGVLPQNVASGIRLQDIFTPARIPELSPLQAWSDGLETSTGPQLFLLEDVTGAGKTEAALTLAYRLMAAGEADGLFIGLPTMATANAMYERVAAVADRLYVPESRPSVVLAHGKRDLVSSFRTTVVAMDQPEHDPRQLDETASARCTAWLANHNKKALLASIGVGTIDQALLAVLHARHQSLRLLGLFRKVLIVDEVHACDPYMQELLEGLLQFHAAAGGSAILVSATLTSAMKQKLVCAFAAGCGWPAPRLGAASYPLVTQLAQARASEHPLGTRPDVRRRIEVDYVSDADAIWREIRAAIAAGRCVCWIRNTVADASETWQRARSELPGTRCILFHARFALGDRLDIEEQLRKDFGPRSTAGERRARLVIATQVIEQSLDVDFDLVVSDLAPIDRVIQRSGRLQRHPRTQDGTPGPGPDERGAPRMIVFGPEWTEQPESKWIGEFFPRAAAVYPHVGRLWLTARELVTRKGYRMPEDARALIDAVFTVDADIPPALERRSNEAEGKDWAGVNLAFATRLKIETGYTRGYAGAWLADEAAPVLASEDGWDLGAPTRQGETTATVYIARLQDRLCVPWRNGADAWELSSVRVIARYVKEAETAPDRVAAVDAARATLPDEGKWSILLAFARNELGVWQARSRDVRGRLRRWSYDESAGLRELPAERSVLEGERAT